MSNTGVTMQDALDSSDFLDFMKDDINSIEILPDQRIEAVQQIEKYYVHISRLGTLAENIVIEDNDSCKRALDICGDAKTIFKHIEEYRKKAVEPSRKVIQTINDCAKDLQKALNLINATLSVKLMGWQKTQEKAALEAQEAVKDLSESLGLSVDIIAPNAPKTMSSAKASTATRETVGFVIEDMSLVPEEFWIVDEKAIETQIKLGRRNIPGVKITTEKTLIIRRK